VDNPQYVGNEGQYPCLPSSFLHYTSSKVAFYFFEETRLNGGQLTPNDWIAAFNGDVCVGTKPRRDCGDNSDCIINLYGYDPAIAELTIGYMQDEDIPSFKIYDTSENIYIDATSSENIPWLNHETPMIDLLYGCDDQNLNAYGCCEDAVSGWIYEYGDYINECCSIEDLDECGVCYGGGYYQCDNGNQVCNKSKCEIDCDNCESNYTTYVHILPMQHHNSLNHRWYN
jgi:hypothetical protein